MIVILVLRAIHAMTRIEHVMGLPCFCTFKFLFTLRSIHFVYETREAGSGSACAPSMPPWRLQIDRRAR